MSRAALFLVGVLLLGACSEPLDAQLTREVCVDTRLVLERPPRMTAGHLRALEARLHRCELAGLL
jgi:hypothetical protein